MSLDRHLSIRIDDELHARLVRTATGSSKSRLAAQLIDEGLRTGAHPGIVFRAGPAGRRPALVGGPDVWEVARVLRGVGKTGDAGLRETARLTGLHLHQVRAADAYYDVYTAEIDEWIAQVDEETGTGGRSRALAVTGVVAQ